MEQNAFNKLKSELYNPRILQYPDFTREFTITADASKYACGAVLSQQVNGEDKPVAFFSKSFTKGEQNKPPIEQELLFFMQYRHLNHMSMDINSMYELTTSHLFTFII